MSNKPKDKTTKRKKQRKGKKALSIIVAGIIFILLACGDDGDKQNFTPLPPSDYELNTPEATADYSEWK